MFNWIVLAFIEKGHNSVGKGELRDGVEHGLNETFRFYFFITCGPHLTI